MYTPNDKFSLQGLTESNVKSKEFVNSYQRVVQLFYSEFIVVRQLKVDLEPGQAVF